MPDLLDVLAGSQRSRSDAEGRVYELVTGIVKDVRDPDRLGRIRARIAGQHDDDTTNWLMPAGLGGMEGLPKVDDTVIVGFLEGNPAKGVYLCSISSTQNGRPSEAMLLGTTFVGLYNDLVGKLNSLQANYQAFYTFVQGHVHASFGTVSASLVEGIIGVTAHNTGTDAAKGKASDGSVPAAISDSRKVLSATQKVR